jgi:hypothetical protein
MVVRIATARMSSVGAFAVNQSRRVAQHLKWNKLRLNDGGIPAGRPSSSNICRPPLA